MIEINKEKCRKALKCTEEEFETKQKNWTFRKGRTHWMTVWNYVKDEHERKYGNLEDSLDLSSRTTKSRIETQINKVLMGQSSAEVIEFEVERESQPRRRSSQGLADLNLNLSQNSRSSRNSQRNTQRRSHAQTVEEQLETMRARLAESESQREQLQLQLGNLNALADLFKERNRSGNRFEYGYTLQALSLELLAETISATDITKIYTVLGDVMGLVDSPDKHVPKENYFRQLRSKLDSALDKQTRDFIENAEVGFQIHNFYRLLPN